MALTCPLWLCLSSLFCVSLWLGVSLGVAVQSFPVLQSACTTEVYLWRLIHPLLAHLTLVELDLFVLSLYSCLYFVACVHVPGSLLISSAPLHLRTYGQPVQLASYPPSPQPATIANLPGLKYHRFSLDLRSALGPFFAMPCDSSIPCVLMERGRKQWGDRGRWHAKQTCAAAVGFISSVYAAASQPG